MLKGTHSPSAFKHATEVRDSEQLFKNTKKAIVLIHQTHRLRFLSTVTLPSLNIHTSQLRQLSPLYLRISTSSPNMCNGSSSRISQGGSIAVLRRTQHLRRSNMDDMMLFFHNQFSAPGTSVEFQGWNENAQRDRHWVVIQ